MGAEIPRKWVDGSTDMEIGTIAQGSAIGRDPKCRWIMVVCRPLTGDSYKSCGKQRWARYYGVVRSSGTNRLCESCNRRQGSTGFLFGYKARGTR